MVDTYHRELAGGVICDAVNKVSRRDLFKIDPVDLDFIFSTDFEMFCSLAKINAFSARYFVMRNLKFRMMLFSVVMMNGGRIC